MPMIREIQRLRAEHAALTTLSHILLDMVRAPRAPRPTELVSARGLFRDALLRHLKCEDWALYPRLRATEDSEIVRITREFEIEMGDLAADFAAYDEKWTVEQVMTAWPEFCREMIVMLDMLAARIEREENELYPIAETLRIARPAADLTRLSKADR